MNHDLLETLRPAAERIGWTLIHSTWEGLAIATALWLVLAIMGKESPSRRYTASCLALAAMLAAIVITCASVAGSSPMERKPETATLPMAIERGIGDAPSPSPAETSPAAMQSQPAASSRDVKDRISPWLPGIAAAWATGVLAIALWHLGGWIKIRRMTRLQPAHAWDRSLRSLATQMGVSRGVKVVESALASVPAVVGFFRPVILLPLGLASEMSPAQLDAILAHELAHIKRNDYLINLLQTALETLLFYHPAIWWISRQIRQEREHCCDDLAIAASGDRAAYARALAQVEEICTAGTRLLPAAGGGSLLQRIRRIAGADVSRRRGTPVAAMLLAAVFAAAVILPATHWPASAADLPATRNTMDPAAAPATTQASTQEFWQGMPISPIRPEDLVSEVSEYQIAPNDRLQITIEGSNVAANLLPRVNPDGKIDLPEIRQLHPRIGDLQAAGLTAAELKQAVAKAYQDTKQPAAVVKVTAQILEKRGASFSILGPGTKHAGQYHIPKPNLTLADAVQVVGDIDKSAIIHLFRNDVPEQRLMKVKMSALLAGDKSVNLIVRPGDTLFVHAPDQNPASKPTDARLKGEYYMVGRILRPGAYSHNGGNEITLSHALISAGMPVQGGRYVTLLHRDGDHESTIVTNALIEDSNAPEMKTPLHPGDIVTVTTEKAPVVQNQKIRPPTHAWISGEVYITGIPREGAYRIPSQLTLRQLITRIGPSLDGSREHTLQIDRQEPGKAPAHIEINLQSLLNGTTDDLDLQPDDHINLHQTKP